jgi:hypothetical protein
MLKEFLHFILKSCVNFVKIAQILTVMDMHAARGR